MTYPTRNDIAETERKQIAGLLNQQLADLLDLGLQAKQAHWNVKGPNFIGLHELFDKVAEELEEASDEIAERTVALGGVALGTVQSISASTRLEAYPTGISSGKSHVTALANALASVAATTRTAIGTAADQKDVDTSDLMTGVSRTIDKLLWMLEAHLQAEE